MAEFFHPVPLWVVVVAILFATGITVLACLPHDWVGRALRFRPTP